MSRDADLPPDGGRHRPKPVAILPPRPRHVEGLAQLSRAFAEESSWASTIPIGRITDQREAFSRLFGQKVIAVRIAETPSGSVVGYVGVYHHPEVDHVSILVRADYRRTGLGRQLMDEVFDSLPEGLEIEAWVGAFNEVSLQAMSGLGFESDRMITDRGRTVHIFTRQS